MAGKQRSVFIRFNMADEADCDLYLRLAEAAGSSASLTSYVKRVLEEYFRIRMEITGRQAFHDQIVSVIREEMQAQGMKLVGASLAGIGTVNVPVRQNEVGENGTELPDTCEKLPDELSSVLDAASDRVYLYRHVGVDKDGISGTIPRIPPDATVK